MNNLRKCVLGRTIKRTGLGTSEQSFIPVKWDKYFESEEKIHVKDGVFNIYKKGDSGPVMLCLHGGGYSGLTWALFAVEITTLIECQVVSIDLRGHGNTITSNDTDLNLETLADDVIEIMNKLFGDENQVPVVIIGHSMGGAIAVECALTLPNTVGLCVIDVVEGTALDALSSMQSILRGRPSQFKSIQHAIQWCYKSGQTNNVDAAKVSMPGQIINMKDGNLAANDCDKIELKNSIELNQKGIILASNAITEICEENESDSNFDSNSKPPLPKTAKTEFTIPIIDSNNTKYTWRIDLSQTEPYWSGWFRGLSEKFLSVHTPKLLLLANIHGLDTTLTIGQMQGKFQLQVLSKSGHAIHEDQPHNVAEIIGGYLVKQKIAVGNVDLVAPMPGC